MITVLSNDSLSACRRPCRSGNRGMTLLELTVVILVLLTLVTVLFFGAQAWKRGSDRAICIIHIQAVQKGVRSYANLYGFQEGSTAPSLQSRIIGLGRYVETTPNCPGSGTYTFGGDTIPVIGDLYMKCSLSPTDQHEPPSHADW